MDIGNNRIATKMAAWFRKYDVLTLGCSFYLQLLGPGLLGVLVDRMAGTTPGASLAGVLVGVFCATIYLVRAMRFRFEALSPPEDSAGRTESDQTDR
jgi:hypothetical protein